METPLDWPAYKWPSVAELAAAQKAALDGQDAGGVGADARRRAGALSEWQGRQVPQQAQMQRQELQQQEAARGMTERNKTDPLNFTPQRVCRVPFQSDDTSYDGSTSAAADDTSDDDSTSAAPPLLSAGETTAGTTLPSVSFPPSVGSKAREQRVSWSKTELL
jgi:hypothetical protein